MLKINCNYEELDYLALEQDEYCEKNEVSITTRFHNKEEELTIYLNKKTALELAYKLIEFAKEQK